MGISYKLVQSLCSTKSSWSSANDEDVNIARRHNISGVLTVQDAESVGIGER